MKQECKTSKSAELFIVSCEIITWTCDKGKALYEEGVIEKKFEEEMKKNMEFEAGFLFAAIELHVS